MMAKFTLPSIGLMVGDDMYNMLHHCMFKLMCCILGTYQLKHFTKHSLIDIPWPLLELQLLP